MLLKKLLIHQLLSTGDKHFYSPSFVSKVSRSRHKKSHCVTFLNFQVFNKMHLKFKNIAIYLTELFVLLNLFCSIHALDTYKLNITKNEITSVAISSIMNYVGSDKSKMFKIYVLKDKKCFECFEDLLTRIIKKLNVSISVHIIHEMKPTDFLIGQHIVLLNDDNQGFLLPFCQHH